MPAQFGFASELEVSILRLMARDLAFLSYSVDLLQPEYFSTKAFQWHFVTMRNFYKDHKNNIDPASCKNELTKAYSKGEFDDFTGQAYIDIYNALWDSYKPSISYIQDQVAKFACKQAMIQAIKKAPELLETEKFDDLAHQILQANNIHRVGYDTGHHYFKEYTERWNKAEEEETAIPTGIIKLDMLLRNGGLSQKELGVIMGPPNRGKSTFLIHIGKRAVYAHKKVFHVTLEMSKEKVAARYDSAFSGINAKITKMCIDSTDPILQHDPQSPFKKKTLPLKAKLNKLAKIFGDSLIIKEYPTRAATVSMIESDIESLRASGFAPDILILDYADIMRATSKYMARWEEQGEIYESLRGLAVKQQIPIWTGCQANRASMSKQKVSMSDIADSFEKAKISDVILGLCQTDDEKDAQLMRIYVAKNRDAASGQELLLKTDFAHMQFAVLSPDEYSHQALMNQKKIMDQYKEKDKNRKS